MKLCETEEKSDDLKEKIILKIHNSFELKIRPEKQIAEVLGLSRNQVKKMVQQKDIQLENVSPRFISAYVDNYIFD